MGGLDPPIQATKRRAAPAALDARLPSHRALRGSGGGHGEDGLRLFSRDLLGVGLSRVRRSRT